VLVWQRGSGDGQLLMIANFTPVPREPYDVVVSSSSTWTLLANSDDAAYGGSGYLQRDEFSSSVSPGGVTKLHATLPPLSLLVLERKN
jgi:1,4-alpha-glucan branching enzyme